MTLQPDVSENSITTTELTISYNGESLDNNTIDVNDLAFTLLSIRQLCMQTNEIVNGEYAVASLHIRTTRPGSFEVELVLVVINVAANMLSGNIVSSAANLKQLLVGSPNVLGVFSAFKRLRGRPFRVSDNSRNADDQDAIMLEAKELKISVPVSVANVITDSIIQRSLHDILTPLKEQNVDEIVIRDENGEGISLKSDDFDEIEDYEDEITNTIDIPNQSLSISAPSLDKPHNKWRLHDGQTTHWYSVLDENFLRRVESNEIRFGTGDVLTCRVRIVQRVSSFDTITSRYEIVEVIDHRENERQLSFLDRM